MHHQHLLRRFIQAESGTTAVEFACVATAFFMLLMGIIEYGMFTMTQVAIESAVTQAGRVASIGATYGEADRVTAVRHMIERKVSGLPNGGVVSVDAVVVSAPTDHTVAGDYCMINGVMSQPATCSGPGTVVVDGNGDHIYQGPNLGTVTVGQAGDLVEIRATYPWKVLFPMLGEFFGTDGVVLISSTTVVKNEPFSVN